MLHHIKKIIKHLPYPSLLAGLSSKGRQERRVENPPHIRNTRQEEGQRIAHLVQKMRGTIDKILASPIRGGL
ncbi:MAG: hypothetical protein AAB893_02655, partial [Patescibacteria group bacterium]